jgi:hypothetical protein
MTNLITNTRAPRRSAERVILLLWTLALLGDFQRSYGRPPSTQGNPDAQGAVVLHTYDTSLATEVANAIPVEAERLWPLLPAEYDLIPAAAVGLGEWDQGVVAIVNFQGLDATIDHRRPRRDPSTRIYVTILVAPPAAASTAGVDVSGALHFYTLAAYSDDSAFAGSLRVADLPIEFVPRLTFDRQIDELSGVGELTVAVPSRQSPFRSVNTAFGYAPSSAIDAVFWHHGTKGTAILHFFNEPALRGDAISLVFTPPGGAWGDLLSGGGFGPGPTDPETGFNSVIAPALNFLYPQGSRGRLLLIRD